MQHLYTAAALFAVALTAQADTLDGHEFQARTVQPQQAGIVGPHILGASQRGPAAAEDNASQPMQLAASQSRRYPPSRPPQAGLRRIGLAAEVVLRRERELMLGPPKTDDEAEKRSSSVAKRLVDAKPIPMSNGRWLYPVDPEGNTYRSSDGQRYVRHGNFIVNPDTGHMLYQR